MNKPVLECTGIAAGYVKGLNILNGVDLVLNSVKLFQLLVQMVLVNQHY